MTRRKKRTPRCRHIQSQTTWRTDELGEYAFARHCRDCNTQLSLGPSNDSDDAEMRVAGLIATSHPFSMDAWALSGGTIVLGGGLPSDYDWDPARPVAVQYPVGDRLAEDLHDGARAARDAARDGHTGPAAVVELITGPEPEPGVELEVGPLPSGSHDRVDCPCDHPPGEVGPCGGCNCADGADGDSAPPAREDNGTVSFREGDARWHDGPGWYYIVDEYPDEGSFGAFATRAKAVEHALDAGFRVHRKDSPPVEHRSTCDKATDAAFPCNAGCDPGGES